MTLDISKLPPPITVPINAAHARLMDLPFSWRGRLPLGQLTVIAGQPGASKSTLAALIAAEQSQRGLVTCLFNVEDDPEAVVLPCLGAHQARMDLVYMSDELLHLPSEINLLEDSIRELGATTIVLDPIATHFPRTHDRRGLHELARMARRTRCAVVCLHHMLKGKRGLEGIAGATGGLAGTARAAYELYSDCKDEDTVILDPLKVNGTLKPSRIVFHRKQTTFKGHHTIRLVSGSRRFDYAAPGVIADAAEWLSIFLSAGEGFARPLAEVKVEGLRVGIPGKVLAGLLEDMDLEVTKRADVPMLRLPDDHPWRED